MFKAFPKYIFALLILFFSTFAALQVQAGTCYIENIYDSDGNEVDWTGNWSEVEWSGNKLCDSQPGTDDKVVITSDDKAEAKVTLDQDIAVGAISLVTGGEGEGGELIYRLYASSHTITLSAKEPMYIAPTGLFYAETSTVQLSDADHSFTKGENITFYNLQWAEPLTAARTITITSDGLYDEGESREIKIKGTFNLGGTAEHLVTFTGGGKVSPDVTVNYCINDSSSPVQGITCKIPPKPPADLSATPISETEINLSWKDTSDNETGFKIFQGGSLIHTSAANATSYNVTGVTKSAFFSKQR